MYKITFQIEGATPVIMEANEGDNLLELARRGNVAIDAPCSGNGSCGKCRVKLLSGQVESAPSRHITPEEYQEGWRLACGCKVVEDAEILVPDIASAYQSRMKTADLSSPEEVALFTAIQQDVQAAGIAFKTGFRALSLTLAEPSLDDTMPDDERLTWAIQEAAGVEQIDVPHHVMVKLAETLRQHSFQVCIKGLLTENRFSVLDITGPQDTGLYAAAIDIGTTTVSAVLAEMTTGKIVAKGSSGNGQIRYGADVINRIIEQGKPGGRKKLQNAIVKETLVPILVNLCKAAGISAQSILQLCVAANTTMNTCSWAWTPPLCAWSPTFPPSSLGMG